MSFFLVNEQYGEGFELNEYNGEYSLIAARQSGEKVYQRWGDIEVAKDKKKRLPVSVRLGNKERAIDTLRKVLFTLEGNGIEQDDDVPF